MGFLKSVAWLLDEHPEKTLEQRLVSAIDTIESTLHEAVTKTEQGVQQLDALSEKTKAVSERIERTTDIIQSKLAEPSGVSTKDIT